jgi:RNA polymerase sigma factor (sigma-70 family)
MPENSLENYKAFLKGSQAGLEGLVVEYSDNMVYYAYIATGNFNIAEDLMETAFLKLVLKRPSLKTDGDIAVFLYKSLDDAIKERTKRKPQKAVLSNLFGQIKDIPESRWVSSFIVKTAEDKIKFDILSHYESKAKPILFLYFFQKLNKTQISAITGTDVNFVSKIIAAGRERVLYAASSRTSSEIVVETLFSKKGGGNQ